MPHVIVKMFAGRSDEEKKRLSDALTLAMINALGASERSISVAIEDVDPQEWTEKVYNTDILSRPELIFKSPGYEPF